jgi:hypothetical protein
MEDGIYYGLNLLEHSWEQIEEPKTFNEVRDAILQDYVLKERYVRRT